MNNHTLQQVIDLAVKTAVFKAKKEAILECRPIGSYFITETEDDPNILFGGRWQKLTGRYVLQCSDDSHKAGTTVEAGLPNIIAHYDDNIGYANADMVGWHGAVYLGNAASSLITSKKTEDGKKYCHTWDFDASKSNPIYGNSDTVQPPARIVNVWKRIS